MAKHVICDNCGAKDDWSQNGRPFFPDGLVLQFRDDNGGDEFDDELEICPSCKEKLLEAFPALAKTLKNLHSGEPSTLKPLHPGPT